MILSNVRENFDRIGVEGTLNYNKKKVYIEID